MDQSINIPSDSGSSISVSKTQLATLVSAGAIIPGEYYSITDPVLGGTIILQAVSATKLSPAGTWLRPTNLTGFGWIRLLTGAAGSVDDLTVNGVNQMTASVPFVTSLNQTAINVAININANSGAAYTALAILDTIVVYQKVASALANTHVVASTTTTITTGNTQNIVNGYDSTIQSLDITYDIANDQIRSCVDSFTNNRMYVSERDRLTFLGFTPSVEPFNSFRWGDPCYHGNEMDNGFIMNVFCAGTDGSTGRVAENHIMSQSGISNCVVGSTAQLSHNNIESTFGSAIVNNLVLGTSSFLTQNRIRFGKIQSNIILGSSAGILSVEMPANASTGTLVSGNLLSGNSTQVGFCTLMLAATISNNIISGSSANISSSELTGRTSTINGNTLSGSFATISRCKLNGDSCQINGNTVLGAGNPSIRNNTLSGNSCTINNNIMTSNSLNGGGITACTLNGTSSGINSMNFAVASNIQHITLDAASAIFSGYTFDATFTNLVNIHWRKDNTLRYNMIKTGLTNTANNGATGSDIILGLLPIAKIYPSSVTIEGNGLVGVGASVNVGIETDSTSALVPSTAITSLGTNVIVQSAVTFAKASVTNRRVVMQVTGASLTAGAVQVTAEFKISNF